MRGVSSEATSDGVLIATADADPADLYPSGNGAFEFGRTVSRLMEMQSADYLARGHGEQ